MLFKVLKKTTHVQNIIFLKDLTQCSLKDLTQCRKFIKVIIFHFRVTLSVLSENHLVTCSYSISERPFV